MSKIVVTEGHAQKILQRMWEQCEDEQFCDVVLIAGTEEKRIPAHRAVLCASSDYFKTMFTAPFKESTDREAKVPSVDGEILETLVEYSYLGRLTIEEEIVEQLLVTADSLLLDTVVDACGNFLAENLQTTNCLGIGKLAERYQMESLSEKVKEFCLKHFADLHETEEFLSLISAEKLAQLLSSNDLRAVAEEDVFKSLIRWLEYDPVEREQHKEELLELVRMPLIKPEFLVDHVKSVCTSTASLQLYIEAMEFHLLPKRKQLNASKSTIPRKRIQQFLMAITRERNKMRIIYYCPQQLKWKRWLEGLEDRLDVGVAVMGNDLFVVGGVPLRANAIRSNLQGLSLKNVSPMNESRACVAVAAFKGFVYAVGGYNVNGSLSSVEKWDLESNTWSEVAPMAVTRQDCGIAILGEKLYVIGGCNAFYLNSAECYDPKEDMWTTIASMNETRRLPGVAVINGILYAVGGTGRKTVESYNPETDMWTTMCSLSENVEYPKCITLYDKIIVLYDDRFEEYDPKSGQWRVNSSIKRLRGGVCIFSYSNLSLESNNYIYSM